MDLFNVLLKYDLNTFMCITKQCCSTLYHYPIFSFYYLSANYYIYVHKYSNVPLLLILF